MPPSSSRLGPTEPGGSLDPGEARLEAPSSKSHLVHNLCPSGAKKPGPKVVSSELFFFFS